MAKINVTQGTAGAYGAGELQLKNKAAMSTTLTTVTDNLNTDSQLKLATNLTQVAGTLQIHTDTATYIDAEDASGNNRFTISRDPASQLVTVDFASVPTSLTTPVGAIRTATNGSALANVLTFLENGNIGAGTDTPGAKLDVHSAANVIAQFNRTGTGKSWIQYLLAGAAKWATGNDNTNGNYTVYDSVNSLDRMVVTNAGNVGIGTTTPTQRLEIQNGAAGAAVKVSNSGGGFAQLAVSSNATSVAELSFTNSLGITGGNVGINTTAPNAKLEVAGTSANTDFRISRTVDSTANIYITAPGGSTLTSVFGISGTDIFSIDTNKYIRMAAASGGIQFNGDTAAANALDDYEEGTWTMGVAFGGGSTGVVYGLRTGQYTKIGRQVTVTGQLNITSAGSSTGYATITGLPFTVGNVGGFYASSSIRYENITYTGIMQNFAAVGSTEIFLEQYSVLGSQSVISNTNFLASSSLLISLTYFV